MASTITRRPLPALISLLALLALTALVWWRVMNRDSGEAQAKPKTCPTAAASSTAARGPTTLPPQKTVDVLVLNATGRSGIAAKARETLLADGFRATQRAANDTSTYKVTGEAQIRYSAANKPGALLLHYYFPAAQLVQVPTPSDQVTVSLGAKYRGVEAQKAVTAGLTADKVTLSTAAPTAPATTASASPSC